MQINKLAREICSMPKEVSWIHEECMLIRTAGISLALI